MRVEGTEDCDVSKRTSPDEKIMTIEDGVCSEQLTATWIGVRIVKSFGTNGDVDLVESVVKTTGEKIPEESELKWNGVVGNLRKKMNKKKNVNNLTKLLLMNIFNLFNINIDDRYIRWWWIIWI